MAHAHGGSHGGVRLHRVFLQSTPAPLGAPLSQSSTVRKENPQPDHRGLTVTCPRKTGELQCAAGTGIGASVMADPASGRVRNKLPNVWGSSAASSFNQGGRCRPWPRLD